MSKEFFVIAGPCVIESSETCLWLAHKIKQISEQTGVNIIFKASFDKANRSKLGSYRGPGIDKGLEILATVKRLFKLPITTDVHEVSEVGAVGKVVDCIQIPAFLCRQIDLLLAVGVTGKMVNVKKGQFMSAVQMKDVIERVKSTGNKNILITERGTTFGHGAVVNDFAEMARMKEFGCPIVFDATHSIKKSYPFKTEIYDALVLAKAGVAAGADGLFVEVHRSPKDALCDADNSLAIALLEPLIKVCKKVHQVVRE